MESDLYREKICAKININILNFAYFLDIFNIREKMANVRKKEYMQEKNLRLKRQLILQSFTPLFALVLIKYFDWNIIPCIILFFRKLFHGDICVFVRLWKNPVLGTFLISCMCILWIIIGLIALWQFNDVQFSGFVDRGEKIVIEEELTDSGITFFMTFVLPLLLDDITTFRGFLLFCGTLGLVFALMWRTNLYYQNPILTILGYKIYKVYFTTNPKDKYIVICRRELKSEMIVRWKVVSDNVLLMYNKNAEAESRK